LRRTSSGPRIWNCIALLSSRKLSPQPDPLQVSARGGFSALSAPWRTLRPNFPDNKEDAMSTSVLTRMAITALVACTVAALAAPATGQTLRRDGSKAVPFVANVGEKPVDSPALRRDGAKAVPFVADLDPEPAADSQGFDWRAAGIAVGVGAVALVLAAAAAVSLRARQAAPGRGS
jgi:hypothetical protein